MPESQYDPKGRYDVIARHTGEKVAELVKGILYEGPPDYRQAVDSVSVKGDEGGLTLEYDGVVFDLVPQPLKA